MEAEVTGVRGGRGAAEAEVHVMCGFQDEHMFVTHTVHDLTLHQVLHSTKHNVHTSLVRQIVEYQGKVEVRVTNMNVYQDAGPLKNEVAPK